MQRGKAKQGFAGDALQPTLLRRSGFQARLKPGVGSAQEIQKMIDMIGMPEIAKRLKVDSSTVRRLIARENEALQLELHRGKQGRLFLSRQDADKLIASYEARRGPVPAAEEDEKKYDRYGSFYIIQLVPEALPKRVKIGFAENIEQRLTEHHTAAPTAKLLKSWPCKRS